MDVKSVAKQVFKFVASPQFIAILGIAATAVKLVHQLDELRKSERRIGFHTGER